MFNAYQLPTSHDENGSQKSERRTNDTTFHLTQRSRSHRSYQRWTIVGLTLLVMVNVWAVFSIKLPSMQKYSAFGVLPIPTFENQHDYEATLVVSSMSNDDTSWLAEVQPQWYRKINVTDNQSSILTVPKNKGREAMVYLTYIINHYHELAPVTIFQHSARYQWHNDDPLYDGERMLNRLQLGNVLAQGYVNLRCVWTLGCPAEISPSTVQPDDQSISDTTEAHYAKAFRELFPSLPMPEKVGVSCCAQFAVSKERIRQQPLAAYVHYREWLLETELPDDISGRIFEYSWHIIFGKEAVFCPDAKSCYCRVYGLCNLACETAGTCSSQYTLPQYSTLPEPWPDIGWDGEVRNISQMREEQAKDFSPARRTYYRSWSWAVRSSRLMVR